MSREKDRWKFNLFFTLFGVMAAMGFFFAIGAIWTDDKTLGDHLGGMAGLFGIVGVVGLLITSLTKSGS